MITVIHKRRDWKNAREWEYLERVFTIPGTAHIDEIVGYIDSMMHKEGWVKPEDEIILKMNYK